MWIHLSRQGQNLSPCPLELVYFYKLVPFCLIYRLAYGEGAPWLLNATEK